MIAAGVAGAQRTGSNEPALEGVGAGQAAVPKEPRPARTIFLRTLADAQNLAILVISSFMTSP